jgi:IS30 family transposase
MAAQLTLAQRAILAELLKQNCTKREIACRLGVHRSTVYRELKRNTGPIGYLYQEAQQRTDIRRKLRRRARKIEDPKVREFVCRGLQNRWSPDQIAGCSRREFACSPHRHVSRQTIDNWIERQGSNRAQWRGFLRLGRPRRKRPENPGRLPNSVSIEGRPKVVDRRERFGDWEGDTIVSSGHRGGLATLVERKSGYTMLARVDDRKSRTVRLAAEQRLSPLPTFLRRTITFDNGKEFAEHPSLAATTGMSIYFARPYCAWQRGTNENTNGLVRQYLPKGTDFRDVSHRVVAEIESSLNDRPRKRLNYRTPHEVLATLLAQRRVAFDI